MKIKHVFFFGSHYCVPLPGAPAEGYNNRNYLLSIIKLLFLFTSVANRYHIIVYIKIIQNRDENMIIIIRNHFFSLIIYITMRREKRFLFLLYYNIAYAPWKNLPSDTWKYYSLSSVYSVVELLAR